MNTATNLPTATEFDHNYHYSEKHYFSANFEEYVRHNVDVYNIINYKGREFSAVYQTGCSFRGMDYSAPSAKLELSAEGGTDKVLVAIDALTEADIENMDSEAVSDFIDDLNCPSVQKKEDIYNLYVAINQNLIDVRNEFDCIFDDEFQPVFLDD